MKSKRCLAAWVKPRTIFDVPALTAKIQDLEKISAHPEFWNDQTQAQETLQELNDLKAHIQQYDKWQASLEDTKAVVDLL